MISKEYFCAVYSIQTLDDEIWKTDSIVNETEDQMIAALDRRTLEYQDRFWVHAVHRCVERFNYEKPTQKGRLVN